MTNHICEIFSAIDKASTRDEKKAILKTNDSPTLRTILRYTYDPSIKFRVDQFPPYKKDNGPIGTCYTNLFVETPKMWRFIDSKENKLTSTRIQILLIQLCEALQADEAQIVKNMIVYKKQDVKGLTIKLIEEVFPGLIGNNATNDSEV